jgi:acyl carrier protein
MMDEPLISALETHIASNVLKQPGKQIDADAPLISSGLIDSFSLVDVALHVEDTYGVRIADTELNSATFDTLAELAALIRARGGA